MSVDDEGWNWVVTVEESGTSKYLCDDSACEHSLGTRLSTLRSDVGLSQQDIEDFLGIRKADLLAIEAGLIEVDDELLEQFAMAYGVSVSELRRKE